MLSTLTSQESGELAQSSADGASDSDVQAAAAGAYKFFHGFSAQAFLSDRAVIIQGEATEIERARTMPRKRLHTLICTPYWRWHILSEVEMMCLIFCACRYADANLQIGFKHDLAAGQNCRKSSRVFLPAACLSTKYSSLYAFKNACVGKY